MLIRIFLVPGSGACCDVGAGFKEAFPFLELVEELSWVGRERECVGEKLSFRRVHPRACGGTSLTTTSRFSRMGLSPRLRGNQRNRDMVRVDWGSIPAPAGEPYPGKWPNRFREVYPRACGGTGCLGYAQIPVQGLSPRLRGNRMSGLCPNPGAGSIPAPAGEPRKKSKSKAATWVYPRACGGTKEKVEIQSCDLGLSPRLRGNQGKSRNPKLRPGSIPAPAGEPMRTGSVSMRTGVYPRACGGTDAWFNHPRYTLGLSPRLRGNRECIMSKKHKKRSIPAPAGEPRCGKGWSLMLRVYPRACGGTTMVIPSPTPRAGLSPRLRGNRIAVEGDRGLDGSIPAPAGEPTLYYEQVDAAMVYPRACGGTGFAADTAMRQGGLSPRLRGNPDAATDRRVVYGSIPAPAGEPAVDYQFHTHRTVYPRACGGTRGPGDSLQNAGGLSPRLRGNLTTTAMRMVVIGSIPAPAGEPQRSLKSISCGTVYPRACGGTFGVRISWHYRKGLSPRLRGNRYVPPFIGEVGGSIPAPAGEPPLSLSRSRKSRVYPRACGGT